MSLPWPMLALMSAVLALWGRVGLALAWLIADECYLRPGELMSLQHRWVIPNSTSVGRQFGTPCCCCTREPRECAATHCKFGDSVFIDSPGGEWHSEKFEAWAATKSSQEFLFASVAHDRRLLMSRAAVALR